MPEICANAALYFDPYKEMEIAETNRLLISDSELRDQLRKASLKRSKFFDWNKTALETLDVMEKIYL